MKEQHDIIIVGAGFVGLTLAFALANQGKRVALIEAHSLQEKKHQHTVDGRALALSFRSKTILEQLNIWPHLENSANLMREVLVSQQGSFGKLFLNAKKSEDLGYVIPAPHLGAVLLDLCEQQKNITWYSPVTVEKITQEHGKINAHLSSPSLRAKRGNPGSNTNSSSEPGLLRLSARNDGGSALKDGSSVCNDEVSANLMIVAEGTQSLTRTQIAFSTWTRDYQQFAITANVNLSAAKSNIAFQRFTNEGTIALLPLGDLRYTLVWSVSAKDYENLIALPDDLFLEKIQNLIGFQLGTATDLGARQSYPLKAVFVEKAYENRLLLMGNAAHTLNPIAAQGFNLTLRDIECLLSLLEVNQPIETLLAQYQQERLHDQKNMLHFTDGLVNLSTLPMVKNLRGIGLSGINYLPFIKHRLFEHLLGY